MENPSSGGLCCAAPTGHKSRFHSCRLGVGLAGKSPCTWQSHRSWRSTACSCQHNTSVLCSQFHPKHKLLVPTLRLLLEVQLTSQVSASQSYRNSMLAPMTWQGPCQVCNLACKRPNLGPGRNTGSLELHSNGSCGNLLRLLSTAWRPNLPHWESEDLTGRKSNSDDLHQSNQVPKANTLTCMQPNLVLSRSNACPARCNI